MKHVTMKQLPEDERPYEKVRKFGVNSLTDAELLSVLLRSGTQGHSSLAMAKDILYSGSEKSQLLNIHHLTYEQLISMKGIGHVKAIQTLCLSEIAKRLAKATAKEGIIFEKPSTIAEYYMEDMRHLTQEQMKLLMVDTKSKLISEMNISKGTVNAALISPRELFIEALHRNAVSIILLHNHPSGDPMPSKADVSFTRQVKEAGELIGIELLDHIIIGNNCYKSFAEMKLL